MSLTLISKAPRLREKLFIKDLIQLEVSIIKLMKEWENKINKQFLKRENNNQLNLMKFIVREVKSKRSYKH